RTSTTCSSARAARPSGAAGAGSNRPLVASARRTSHFDAVKFLVRRQEGYSTMADPSMPASPGALTPEWLTQALRSTGTITDASVTFCHIELFGAGKGFSGQIARVGLRYDRVEGRAPASLIAKFQLAHADPDIRAAVLHARLHEREYRFYREVAQDIAL